MSNDTLNTEGENAQVADQQQAAQPDAQASDAVAEASTADQQANAESGQGKPEGDKSKDDKPAGAPEAYEFKAPEGKEFSEEVLGAFEEIARELNLPQDTAQGVLDKLAPAFAEREAAAMEQARTEWAEASKADKEIGGDKLPETLAVAKKFLDAFGSPELSTLLDQSGLGNHPEFIRAFYRAGKATGEDRIVTGNVGTAQTDPAKRLFPNQA